MSIVQAALVRMLGSGSTSSGAARAGLPLVSTDRVFSVIPGTLPEAELELRLENPTAVNLLEIRILARDSPGVAVGVGEVVLELAPD